MTNRAKPLREVDGNAPGASRYAEVASKIILGGKVMDAEAIDFESIVRFRYHVRGASFWYHVIRLDKRTHDVTVVAGPHLFRKTAQEIAALLNEASDLGTEEGWL